MKPTQITELLANIKNTFVSFFSILMFVALGVGIFLGITWSGPALQTAADRVYDEGSLHDFQVSFTYGLTDDDLAKLADVEGVTAVEPARQSFQQVTVGTCDFVVKVQTIGSQVNVPILVEGELPRKADEVALLAEAAKEVGLGVGDTIAFQKDAGADSDDADGMQYLSGGTYKVTALVNSPEYLAKSSATYGFSNTASGKVDIVAFALPEAFDSAAFQDAYPIVNVRCDGLRGAATFSDDYKSRAADAKTRVVELGEQLSHARYQDLRDSAQADVDEAEQELADAKGQVAQMKEYGWTVSSRTENAGAAEASTFSDVTNNLSFSMAALFVIVGLLVSYSAVSRIVHEQITQIGTKKALGLREREITLSFLAYSALAVIAGAVIGTIVGIIAVEGIIGHVLGGMFILGDYPPYFGLPLFLAVTLLELALVLGATWFACHSILREHAVELLKGEKPPEAKTRFYEKWGIWERLPLFTQTIVNNCVNDKRRVFSTVVGVAGCTALIVTAITLNNDVLKSYDRHYEHVYGFSYVTYVDTGVSGAADNVESAIQAGGSQTAQVLLKNMVLKQPDGERGSMRVIVPADDEAFARIYHVNTVSGGEVDLHAEGVWVSQGYRDHLGAKVGDLVKVEGADGVEHEVPILGFHEFWLTYDEMVMGRDFYEKEFGESFAPNAVVSSGERAIQEVEAAAGGVEGFNSISDDQESRHRTFAEFANVSSAVVAIYLALAVLMAVVVLLNLNVMFIEEKKRELIVLMINGFSLKDAKRYIYNDTIVLTAIGIVLGLVLGCVMGSITVGAVEPSTATFVKDIDPMAVLVGVVGSAVLAFVMSLIALRRIPRFELTDINKF